MPFNSNSSNFIPLNFPGVAKWKQFMFTSTHAIPVTGPKGPQGCEVSRLPHFLQTIGSQMPVRLSALRTSRPLPPRKIPGTHFC
jgi:hypothetical protein